MGDGIGPEVTQQSVKILDAVAQQFGHRFYFTYCLIGAAAIDKTGTPLPDETLEICLESDAVLFGAIGHPKYDHDPNATVRPGQGLLKLRKSLGIFANIRPVNIYRSLYHLSPLKSKYLDGVDFVIYHELEDIERVAHLAFKHAQTRKKKLTLIDKSNVLETSAVWRRKVQEIAAGYSDAKVDFMFADSAAMQIILNPAQFDVVLAENMFGNIISTEASALAGSTALLPSASVGAATALFQPVHGSNTEAAGKDIANPLGSILSAAMMLEHFRMYDEANLVRKAVEWTLSNGFVSRDIDAANSYSTSTIGDLITDYIENRLPMNIDKGDVLLSKSTII